MTLELKPRTAATTAPVDTDEPLYLVDGHSLTFKAYYAIRNLTAPDGMPTGAVFGFLRMLLRLIDDRRALHLAVVFDTGEPTFRVKVYEDYKANREAPPEDFSEQMHWIYRLLKAMGIPTYELSGYEADDLIATMAGEYEAIGGRTVVVSADKDLFQLVGERTQVLRFKNGDPVLFDGEAVEKSLGVRPEQVPDYLALVGDSSDNIPGVPSIGPKRAAALLRQFGSLDRLLGETEAVKNEKQKTALLENREQARISRQLATVVRDVPFEWRLEDCRLGETLFTDEAVALMVQLGFQSILKERGIEIPDEAKPKTERAVDYRLVDEPEALEQWVEKALQADLVAFDTETTDTNAMRAELVGLSLSIREGEAIYIPVGHRVGTGVDRQIDPERLRAILAPLFAPTTEGAAKKPALAAHHAKFDWEILELAGFDLRPPDFDTMIASFVLDPGRASGHGLKPLASELLGVTMIPISEIIGSGKHAITCAEVPPEDLYEYACRDADVTLRLARLFAEQLREIETLDRLFREIEMPLIPVLKKMEMGGFRIDPEQLKRLSETMHREISRLTKEIWRQAGREFNIGSTKQLAEVLFNDLGLTPGRKTKTGYSTDETTLEGLTSAHPIVQLILDYRGLTKLKSTYADALPQEVNPRTQRIHTSFGQTTAQTGRLASTEPNLQNIPIRSELGREIRRTFVPDAEDHRLLAADYSQIELRLLAHASGDEELRRAFAEGRDVHALTAARIFGVEPGDVTPEMRAQAKVVNFGIIYGMGAHGLSQRLRIPRADAARFIDAYFDGYPGVRRWIEETLARAREIGWVETLRGRRRSLPELNAKNSMIRSNAERIAVNTPLQGSSADMIKLAMIAIDRKLDQAAPGARMALQVHDELIFSVPEAEIESASEFVRKEMIEAMPLDVPIVVDIAVGRNWAEC